MKQIEELERIIDNTLGDDFESEANYLLNTEFKDKLPLLAQAILSSIHLCSCVDGVILTNEQASDGKFRTKQCPVCEGKQFYIKQGE